MYAVEAVKSRLESLTGFGRPSAKEVKKRLKQSKPRAKLFDDDKVVPNNPNLPFIHYPKVASLSGLQDPAALFERLFTTNGWTDAWRNGIYDYVHYHPRTHEVLGIARGHARVRFGGKKGTSLRLAAGDVVILPAGTGHQALKASKDLLVVGAYPRSGKYDEYEGSREEHKKALRMIPKVRLPPKDPVFGKTGALKRLWKRRHRSDTQRFA